ncbi:MAG TPA: AAA family ATPase [Candidatus Acidoferrales bacterium]|nr:AAA family ATPase [Candidatus Acidoferrales bacterium]
MISQPVVCRAFVGRVVELEHLAERRRAASAGRGGCVLVAGEAGIGKSRLLAEFRRALPRRTTRVAAAACREFAQRPLGPLFELVGAFDAAAAERLSRGTFATKDEMLAAFVDAFDRIAAGSTTLALVEDLHWADPDIVAVLHALTQRAADRRLLLVATYRDDELDASHRSFTLIGRILRERCTSLVRLGRFDDREMTRLLGDASRAAPSLPQHLVREVRRRADGNALFGEELLRHAADRYAGGTLRDSEALPLSLHAIVRERLARCRSDDRILLERASLLGRTFDLELLGDAFGVPVATCREAMERLTLLQLVDPAPGETAQYRFRHALTRDAVYGDLDESTLPELHRRIADAIAGRGATERHVEFLAHHYAVAGDRDRAALYCRAAADAARAVHAYDDAALWYERVSANAGTDSETARALVDAGLMHVFGGDLEGALALYERAVQTYERAGCFDDAVAACVMAAGALHDNGRGDDAVALLRHADRSLGSAARPEVRARMLVRLGFLYSFARRTGEAGGVAAAIDPAVLAGETPLAAEASFLLANLHAQRAEAESWRTRLDRGLEIFERIGALPDNIRVALGNGATQALALGLNDAALAYQRRALELAERLNSGVDHERCVLAEIELWRGNFDAARQLLAAGPPPAKFLARVQRSLVETTLATLAGADLGGTIDRGLIDEAARGGHRGAIADLAAAYALAAVASGRDAEADEFFARSASAVTTAYDMTMPIAAIARWRPALLAGIAGFVDAAAEPATDRVGAALAALVAAAQARARGDTAAARARGRDAARYYAEIGWPLLEAWSYDIGGDPSAARERYRALGAHAELRRLERSAIAGASTAPSLLTARERDIARAIAGGKSNRAAAQTLSVTEKAVEKHLTSIYAKLGINSRAQLAAYVVDAMGERTP